MKKNRLYIIVFLLLVVAAAALYLNKSNSTIRKELRDFAVKDTASIDKIFMADRQGGTVTLERKSSDTWMVNNHIEARNDAINTLLTTIASMEVRSPVGKNMYNNLMKQLAGSSVKTELYSGGKLIKTFYVGHPTMDNLGTYMYLEGSSVPFVMYIPGFNGFLTSRFFTSENEWRKKQLLAYNPRFISTVKITDGISPDSSLLLRKVNDSTYTYSNGNSEAVKAANPKVVRFLSSFSNVAFEFIDTHLSQGLKDSLIKAGPFKKVEVDVVNGNKGELHCYRKPVTESTINKTDAQGRPVPFDYDRMYVRMSGDTTWYVCQYYTMDKLLKTPSYFKGPQTAL